MSGPLLERWPVVVRRGWIGAGRLLRLVLVLLLFGLGLQSGLALTIVLGLLGKHDAAEAGLDLIEL